MGGEIALLRFDQAGSLAEMANRKPRGESGRSQSGQDVVGPGKIVSQRLWTVMSQEHGPGVADLTEYRPGITDTELQMFRSQPVGHLESGGEIRRMNAGPVIR